MKRMKNICTVLVCVLLTLGLAMTVFAADSVVAYKGRKSGFEFAPGSSYIESDLFDDFKDVMPGDVRDEKVTIVNDSAYSDYIKVYMRALLHDTENNPVSPAVLAALEADERRGTMSELEYMHGFLEQLTVTVWNGEKKDENIIYQGTPDSLEEGFEDGNAFLGSLGYHQSLDLNIQLAVDKKMGNEYAGRIGEVDWVFVVEEHDNPSDSDDSGGGGSKPGNTPESKPGTQDWPVDVIGPDVSAEAEDGFHLNVLPLTGDGIVIWPFVVVGLLALIGLIVLIKGRRKEEE